VIASVAAIGIPAGWYGRAKAAAVASQPATTTAAVVTEPAEANQPAALAESSPASEQTDETALAARRQHEKEKAKAREEKAAPALTQPPTAPAAPAPASVAADSAKSGPKKITVIVSYDESGRVTQASGGDASAIRIARQKRFPAGKAGSATITIPIN
jgi:hypothetical protein